VRKNSAPKTRDSPWSYRATIHIPELRLALGDTGLSACYFFQLEPRRSAFFSVGQLLLNRTPGPAKVNGWVNQLPTLGRAGVALGFLQSVEYRGIVVRSYYSGLLHRSQPPSQAEVNGWVFSPLDIGNVRIGFESSGEFYADA
jgi:hypothetical protein